MKIRIILFGFIATLITACDLPQNPPEGQFPNDNLAGGKFEPIREMTQEDLNKVFSTGCKTQGSDAEHIPKIDPRLKVGFKTQDILKIIEAGSKPMMVQNLNKVTDIAPGHGFGYSDTIAKAENFGSMTAGQSMPAYCYLADDKCETGFSADIQMRYIFIDILGSTPKYEIGTYTLPDGTKVSAWRKTLTKSGKIMDQGDGGGAQADGTSYETTIGSSDVIPVSVNTCGGGDLFFETLVKDTGGKEVQRIFSGRLTDNP